MVWLGSMAQLSKKYTTGTPSSWVKYCSRFPNVSAELDDTVQVPVKPVSHPLSNTTGGREEPVGTCCLGLTTMVRATVRCSPSALVAESLAVYSPGLTRSGAASKTLSCARFGAATRLTPTPSRSTRRVLAFKRKSSVAGEAAIGADSPTRIS